MKLIKTFVLLLVAIVIFSNVLQARRATRGHPVSQNRRLASKKAQSQHHLSLIKFDDLIAKIKPPGPLSLFNPLYASAVHIDGPRLKQENEENNVDGQEQATMGEVSNEISDETVNETPKEAPKESPKETPKEAPSQNTNAEATKGEVNTMKIRDLVQTGHHHFKKTTGSKADADPAPATTTQTATDPAAGAAAANDAAKAKDPAAKPAGAAAAATTAPQTVKSDLKIKIGENKNYGEGARTVVAETSGLASVGDDISANTLGALRLRPPRIIPSFTYEDAKLEGVPPQEADLKAAANKEVYYDPKSGILGDRQICSNIQDPYFCVKQNVCGWCGEYNMCIAGTSLKPLQPCNVSTYTYTSYVGWNPQVITITS